MVLFADRALPFVAASYLLTGRFNPEHTFEKYPTAGPDVGNFTVQQAAGSPDERAQLIGTSGEWKQYRKGLDSTVRENKTIIDKNDLSHFFKYLDHTGIAAIDESGSIWMDLWENGEPLKVGVSANNALAPDSNPRLAYKFLLARTSGVLKSPKHSRETMLEFDQDWAMLQHVSAETKATLGEDHRLYR